MGAAILAVGPRELPDGGKVRIWVDTGSGPGHEILVPAADLTVAEEDDGEGVAAVYTLPARECQG